MHKLPKPDPSRANTDYPQGDGDPNCPECWGRGVVSVSPEEAGIQTFGEITTFCKCVWKTEMDRNLERGWVGLSKAKRIKKSPLKGQEGKNLWVTATAERFRAHLRHIALRQGFNWMFRVVTDLDMMDAWLSKNVDKVIDTDIAMKRKRRHGKDLDVYISLTELIEPPKLLILRLGVKVTRNVAAPEAFLESLQHRDHLGKATWVLDQPICRLGPGHLDYDDRVGEYLEDWVRVDLEGGAPPQTSASTTSIASDEAPSLGKSHAQARKSKGGSK